MLSLLDPGTFGAAMRQHERVRTLAEKLQIKQAWQVEIASMLSSMGFSVLPAEVVQKLQARGAALDESEQQMLAASAGDRGPRAREHPAAGAGARAAQAGDRALRNGAAPPRGY